MSAGLSEHYPQNPLGVMPRHFSLTNFWVKTKNTQFFIKQLFNQENKLTKNENYSYLFI